MYCAANESRHNLWTEQRNMENKEQDAIKQCFEENTTEQ
jgi:hypothetical protein